ncbi:MAG: methylglyoxal synthase [Candidatus Krumholzibacteriia bacterium]
MPKQKTIALVAHDHRKADLADWVRYNAGSLSRHKLVCTGTTGAKLAKVLDDGVDMVLLKSGPLGGDLQLGAMISEGKIDVLVFFWDPMEPQPHDVDVKALLRIAVVYNVPVACNRSTADYLVSSPLLAEDYAPRVDPYREHLERNVD